MSTHYTILTGTVFAKTRQSPATIVMLLRGIAKGESTARLSRELDLDRKRLGEIRQQIQTNLYDTLPGEVMSGTAFEADELYQHAGERVGLMANAKPITPTVIRRMCCGDRLHTQTQSLS